jgi:hypothetical protein
MCDVKTQLSFPSTKEKNVSIDCLDGRKIRFSYGNEKDRQDLEKRY